MRRLARLRRALSVAPTSAPAPNTAAIRPNVCAPAWSVRSATSGSRTLKLNENVESTSTPKNATPARGDRMTYRRASSAPPRIVAPWSRIGTCSFEVSIASSASSSARKLAAFTAKATPGPATATIAPPIAGPRILASVPRLEFSPTAFARSAGPTIWKTSACRAAHGLQDPLQDCEQVDLPNGDDVREREHRQRSRDTELHHLAGKRDSPHFEAVDQRSDEEPEHRHRQELHQRERPDCDGRVGQLQHEPGGGDLLHPGPGERDCLASEVEAIVPVLADAREGASAYAHSSAEASIGWPKTSTQSPCSATDGARTQAVTPSSGARIGSASRSGCSSE